MRKRGKLYGKYIHRLVAEYFIPNPNGYKEVDHIDRNRQNNYVENLRWVTHKENMKNRNKGTTKAKPVIQYDLNNNKIAEYEKAIDKYEALIKSKIKFLDEYYQAKNK